MWVWIIIQINHDLVSIKANLGSVGVLVFCHFVLPACGQSAEQRTRARSSGAWAECATAPIGAGWPRRGPSRPPHRPAQARRMPVAAPAADLRIPPNSLYPYPVLC